MTSTICWTHTTHQTYETFLGYTPQQQFQILTTDFKSSSHFSPIYSARKVDTMTWERLYEFPTTTPTCIPIYPICCLIAGLEEALFPTEALAFTQLSLKSSCYITEKFSSLSHIPGMECQRPLELSNRNVFITLMIEPEARSTDRVGADYPKTNHIIRRWSSESLDIS